MNSFIRPEGTVIDIINYPLVMKKKRTHVKCKIKNEELNVPLSYFKQNCANTQVRLEFLKTYHPENTFTQRIYECETDIELHQFLQGRRIIVEKVYNVGGNERFRIFNLIKNI